MFLDTFFKIYIILCLKLNHFLDSESVLDSLSINDVKLFFFFRLIPTISVLKPGWFPLLFILSVVAFSSGPIPALVILPWSFPNWSSKESNHFMASFLAKLGLFLPINLFNIVFFALLLSPLTVRSTITKEGNAVIPNSSVTSSQLSTSILTKLIFSLYWNSSTNSWKKLIWFKGCVLTLQIQSIKY